MPWSRAEAPVTTLERISPALPPLLAAFQEAAQRQAERLESAAQMEAKKQMLAAKQACLDEAFAQAQKKLCALPDEEYAVLLKRLGIPLSPFGVDEAFQKKQTFLHHSLDASQKQ